MRYKRAKIPLIAGLLVLLGYFIGQISVPKGGFTRYTKVDHLLQLIAQYHLDEVGVDSLLDETIAEMLHKLDPHSAYLNPHEVLRSEESVRGSFDGIGIEFIVLNDSVLVQSVIDQGPAMQAGIRGGDVLLEADGQLLSGASLSNTEVIKALKGISGSKVGIKYWRPLGDQSFDIELKRAPVAIPSLDVSFINEKHIAYIRLNRFSEKSTRELQYVIQKLKKDSINGLVLDLRNNPGGLLHEAQSISSFFLDPGDTVFYLEDRLGNQKFYEAKVVKPTVKWPLVILINENSASAAEIVAGAVQDNDRGIIMGRRSFGKGLVQEEIALKDGSRVRLTTSRYYTPSGKSIQKPYENGYNDYNQELERRYHNGEMYEAERKSTLDQLYSTKNGRKVPGGGGIYPDVYVPIDSNHAASVFYHLIGQSNWTKDTRRLIALSYDSLKQAISVSGLQDKNEAVYALTQKLIDKNLTSEEKEQLREKEREELQHYVQMQIAMILYGSPAMHEVRMRKDPAVLRAIDLLLENERYEALLKPIGDR